MIRVTDITVKGAALAAVAAGRFSSLPIANPAVECASRKRIRAIQLEKLVAQVRWTYERVPWYRARMDDSGVTPSDIKTLEDVRMLPFTDKCVLRDTFPYGLFAVPLDEVVELHSSSGTTGKPIVVGYNESDMAMWAAASCGSCRWRASCRAIGRRWPSVTACSPAASACTTGCRSWAA